LCTPPPSITTVLTDLPKKTNRNHLCMLSAQYVEYIHDEFLAWIIHDLSGEKREDALKG